MLFVFLFLRIAVLFHWLSPVWSSFSFVLFVFVRINMFYVRTSETTFTLWKVMTFKNSFLYDFVFFIDYTMYFKKVLKVLTTNTQKCSPSLHWIRNKKAVSSMNAVSQSVSEQSVALNSWIRLQHSEPCITGKATPRRDKFRSKTFSTTLYDCWFDYERMKRRDSPVRVALMWLLISEWWISAAISD